MDNRIDDTTKNTEPPKGDAVIYVYEGLPIKEWFKKQNKELMELEKYIVEYEIPLLLIDATKKIR
ncbi:MAG: hypothetical protein WBB06_00510 [Chitinophagaceae bacterium]